MTLLFFWKGIAFFFFLPSRVWKKADLRFLLFSSPWNFSLGKTQDLSFSLEIIRSTSSPHEVGIA